MRRLSLIVIFAAAALFNNAARSQVLLTASLDGSQAGTASPGLGTAYAISSPDNESLTYQVTVSNLIGTITAAHFHIMPSEIIVEPISFTGNTATGTWSSIPDSLLSYFAAGRVYINIHTTNAPGGEIRGFLTPHQFGFSVSLDGSQAGTGSAGRGTGYVTWNDTSTTADFDYGFTVEGLTSPISAAHFHILPTGTIIEPIPLTDSSVVDSWQLSSESFLPSLLKGSIYVLVHTSNFPGGEIRGTVSPVGQLVFSAALDSVEIGTNTPATGTAWGIIAGPDYSSMMYQATYGNLTGTFSAAHFHNTGGIVEPITFTGNTVAGTWSSLTDQDLQDLLQDRIYLNIHSSTNPGGEIRGTMYLWDGTFIASMDGPKASTTSAATGTAWLRLWGPDTAEYRGTVEGLSGAISAAHFHVLPGGAIAQPVSFADGTTKGLWVLPDSIRGKLIGEDVYLNVHTGAFPGGEIRGEFTFNGNTITAVERISEQVPGAFGLEQNYPNPFNPSTTIAFDLPQGADVSLKVFNLLGQEVAVVLNDFRSAGSYRVEFDARTLPSGVYFYTLSTERGQSMTRKMLLVR